MPSDKSENFIQKFVKWKNFKRVCDIKILQMSKIQNINDILKSSVFLNFWLKFKNKKMTNMTNITNKND